MTIQDGPTPGFALHRDDFGRLVLVDQNGHCHVGVEPVRGFPVSDPDRFISLCDAVGQELVSVPDLQALPPVLRDVMEQELARREFVPRIKRILRVSGEGGPTEWDVDTDRGPTRFTVNSDDDVRELGPHRAIVIDEHGIRYMIDDARELDRSSRRLLEHYL